MNAGVPPANISADEVSSADVPASEVPVLPLVVPAAEVPVSVLPTGLVVSNGGIERFIEAAMPQTSACHSLVYP